MALLQLKDISISFGAHPLLDQANLTIEPGERLALIGRNGVGKSTLLKVIEGKIDIDDGELVHDDSLIVSRLIQEVPKDIKGSVKSVIAQGHPQLASTLSKYYSDDIDDIHEVHAQLDEHDGWRVDQRVNKLISTFTLDGEVDFASLSGGLKRRVLLAQALLVEPTLLLLDEPTNHLDIETIEWLESMLMSLNIAMIIISHDRSFVDKLATRIIEIDRGMLTSWPGRFKQYQVAKTKALEDEEKHQAAFDKKLALEEKWIRQGVQARRTRNEGRVRSLKKMRDERSQRRDQIGKAQFNINEVSRSGKLVLEAKNLHYAYPDSGKVVIEEFTSTVLRGDKIGIIGPNGCGKSTLIKLLTEQLKPTEGTVRIGTQLEFAYLDQQRSDIREDQSVMDNVSGGRNEITINGQSRHIISYMQDFLFAPERARSPVTMLSGGERNRLMLAKLFSRPFNFLVLDEPTNDLDMETLELLENLLVEYQGTLLLVSHDREFIDNVVSSTFVFEKSAQGSVINEYIGGYEDWLRQRDVIKKNQAAEKQAKSSSTNTAKTPTAKKVKLSYNDQRELDALPLQIETLEKSLEQLQAKMVSPDFYQKDLAEIDETTSRLKEIETALEHCFSRWEILENSTS